MIPRTNHPRILTKTWLRSTAVTLVSASCASVPSAPVASTAIAFEHVRVIAAPGSPTLEDATVLVDGPRVAAVGPTDSVSIPRGARRIDARGSTVMAGFWNSHVHFTDKDWHPATSLAAAPLILSSRTC